MSTPMISGSTHRAQRLVIATVAAVIAPLSTIGAQGQRESRVQIEVSDSVGLPLPDATVEVFAPANGGAFWEWTLLGETALPSGINLLRFSRPGYEPSMLSVPFREDGKISLRVRLGAPRDSAKASRNPEARELRAVGLALEGRMRTDVIGHRRIIDRAAIDTEATRRFGNLLRRVRGTGLRVLPASGGSVRVTAERSSGRSCSSMLVMVNGDRRKTLAFASFDELYDTRELEAIEVFPRDASIPSAYDVPGARCGLMVVWFRVL